MLLQTTETPENVAYLLLGLLAFVVIVPGWIASLVWRRRNLRRDLALLEQMAADAPADDPDAVSTPGSRPT